ncbi:hypothetical protein ACTQ3A_08090 [Bilifractor sp. LCP21S3_F8]|uniref:hypothetical protein n=1 Tax=Bilifractor sp. LCP21S3_F8 TaxID=3438744 RepID=UPI003F937E86
MAIKNKVDICDRKEDENQCFRQKMHIHVKNDGEVSMRFGLPGAADAYIYEE